jgi:hypothetical protein
MRRTLGLVVILVQAVAGAALAQAPTRDEAAGTWPLPAHVRLTMTDGHRLKLELLGVEPSGLVVRNPGRLQEPSFRVPIADVSAAERSLGRRRGRAAVIGGSIGAAMGLFLLAGANDGGGEGCNVGVCVPLFLGPPALLGAGVGALVAGERWAPVALPQPGGSGAGLSFTIRF